MPSAAITLAQLKDLAADYERKALEAAKSESVSYLKIRDRILELISLHQQLYADLAAQDKSDNL